MACADCMASSRVGARTRAWTSRSAGSIIASSGRPNAAVFPVPVWATPTTSRWSSSGGIAAAWMGVGSTKPMPVTASRSSSGRPREAKVDEGVPSSSRSVSATADPESEEVPGAGSAGAADSSTDSAGSSSGVSVAGAVSAAGCVPATGASVAGAGAVSVPVGATGSVSTSDRVSSGVSGTVSSRGRGVVEAVVPDQGRAGGRPSARPRLTNNTHRSVPVTITVGLRLIARPA